MPWSYIIPAAASLIGGMMASDAASSAAEQSTGQSQAALDLQKRMYEEGVARQQPFLQGGTEDYNRLRALMSGGPDAAKNYLQMEPGYNFRLSEGLKALDRQAAARGGLISGGALKAAQRYGQDVASQEFSNAYNRLAGLAQIGPSAAGVMNTLGQNYSNQASNTYGQMGDIAAQAALARGSSYGRTFNQLGNIYGQYSRQPSGSASGMYSGDPYGNYGAPGTEYGPG